jgi:HD-GYP domain-containing protein (c-di-GMP phosphodiesterase class II)
VNDSYDTPDAEALLEAGEQRRAGDRGPRRGTLTHGAGAVGFLLAASLLAALAPWQRSLSLLNLLLVLAAWVVVGRAQFPVAGGSTYPTMLVFVPALFILPTPLVPLVELLANLLRRVPDLIRGQTRPAVIPVLIADGWYTLAPALVIVVGGAQLFSWAHWPIYVAALLAQIGFDLAWTVTRCWIGEGISPRVQLPLLSWLYAIDVLLAPLGLLIAASAARRPGLLLLALPLIGLLWLFARERRQRLDQTLVLSSAYRGTALLLGEVIEADDAYTGIHSREVVDLSLAVADEIGLDSTARRNVEFTALLHDVGKIRVPKEVLNKPGRLDEDEWKILHRHTIEGERMLRQVGGSLANVGQFVRSSHERYDGNGYPDGLAGDEIPIEARIVSVCDAFNAMTTDRPYRAAMSVAEALEELRREAGRQFDPNVVKAFDSVVSPPVDSRPDPKMPRWVKVPHGQIERALKVLSAERQRREQLDLAELS